MNQRLRWLIVTKAEVENKNTHPNSIAIPYQGGAMPLFLILQMWDMDKWIDVPIDQDVELAPRDTVVELNSRRKSPLSLFDRLKSRMGW